MKKIFTAIALSAMISQAHASCDETLDLSEPGVEKTVALSACIADAAKRNADADVLNAITNCISEQTGIDPDIIKTMTGEQLNKFMEDSGYDPQVYIDELICHNLEMEGNPSYEPLSVLPN